MNRKLHLYVWTAILLIVGIGRAVYLHVELGVPVLPDVEKTAWVVEAKIDFEAFGGPVKVSLNLPDDTATLTVRETGAASPGYGFHHAVGDIENRGIWSSRDRRGPETLYYRVDVYRGAGGKGSAADEAPGTPEKPVFGEPEATAADAILADVYARSSDAQSMTAQIVQRLNGSMPDGNVRTLLRNVNGKTAKIQLLLDLLHSAGIPARSLRGIELTDAGKRSALLQLVEIFDGDSWVAVDPATGRIGVSETFLPWRRGDQSILEIEGGQDSKVSFSVIANERKALGLIRDQMDEMDMALMGYSIHALPLDVQKTFAVLVLIPIGAFVVVVMRNLVGIRTSGTFMPVLLAMAFVQTTLLVGIALVLVVVAVGLLIRGYLSRLNLLLVPRISAVLIVVVTIYFYMTVFGLKLGIADAFSVTLFPIVIIAWTVERMSVCWEEDGPKEVLIQGSGSLVTATLAYLAMTEPHIAYLFSAFPSLILVVLALILIIGQYTGYRLVELRRFEPLAKEK